MPKRSSPTSNRKTSGATQESSSQEGWYEAIEIIDYDPKSDRPYLVRWAGIDPDTGKTYEPSWVNHASGLQLICRNRERTVVQVSLKLGREKENKLSPRN